MFALLDIRLTPLTVLLGQEMCCKSLKITSPDRICHFVITKTTTGSWKVILLTRKQHCENVSLFLNLCYKKNTSTWEFPLPVTFANDWEVRRSILLWEVEIRYTPSVKIRRIELGSEYTFGVSGCIMNNPKNIFNARKIHMDFTSPEGLESQKRWIVQDITIRIDPHSSHQDGDTHLRVFKQEFTNQWVATSIFCTVHGLNHKK